MSALAPDPGPAPQFTWHRARKFLFRALRLRCPHCGRSPLFIPLRQTRSLRDWFTPLDGCPRCGYPYERELGYFLMAIWAVGYGFSALFGISIYLALEFTTDLPMSQLLPAVMIPPVVFAVLFARHAKSLFLAFDHFFDPAVPFREDDDGPGGDPPAPTEIHPPPQAPAAPAETRR
ncbi:MAG: hypothetical protein JSR82_08675 [Verrucomicrobia bacterium]|nr:hypothetical protein [Verrucomicrobiota bacterium]